MIRENNTVIKIPKIPLWARILDWNDGWLIKVFVTMTLIWLIISPFIVWYLLWRN